MVPVFTLGLNDRLNDTTDTLLEEEVIHCNTFKFLGSYTPYGDQTLIKLCVDICKRNGKKKLIWLSDKDKTLAYDPKSGEMVLTVHRWFANKSCPGNWMYARMGDLSEKVTKALQGSYVFNDSA